VAMGPTTLPAARRGKHWSHATRSRRAVHRPTCCLLCLWPVQDCGYHSADLCSLRAGPYGDRALPAQTSRRVMSEQADQALTTGKVTGRTIVTTPSRSLCGCCCSWRERVAVWRSSFGTARATFPPCGGAGPAVQEPVRTGRRRSTCRWPTTRQAVFRRSLAASLAPARHAVRRATLGEPREGRWVDNRQRIQRERVRR